MYTQRYIISFVLGLLCTGILFVLIILFPGIVPQMPEQNFRESPNDAQVSPQISLSGNILVDAPLAGEKIGNPVKISGEARVFEAVFQYRVVDDQGNILAQGYDLTQDSDVGMFGKFALEIPYETPKTPAGFIEVFSYSAKDGSEENMVKISVIFF